jgi:hypothetical protein
MSTKSLKTFSLFLIVALLAAFSAGPAMAASGAGGGPDTGAMPTDSIVRIESGQWQWYVFRSQVPVGVENDSNDLVTSPSDATINATLRVESGAVDFEVWDANNLNEWRNSKEFDPMGAGTENEFLPNDPLFWQGSFTTNTNYYLIVMNRAAEPAYYRLDITGNVSFPSGLALDNAMPAMASDEVMSTEEMALTVDLPAESTVLATAGAGPESAMMPIAGSMEIGVGQWQWYSFRSQVPVGVEGNSNDVVTNPTDATIQAALRIQSGAVDFEVWSADDLNNWRNSKDFEPTGAGTENEFMSGDPLFWQGSFTTNNTYYLIVMNRGSQPASYTLDITGNVGFPSAVNMAVQ